jgi:hypothetical protein
MAGNEKGWLHAGSLALVLAIPSVHAGAIFKCTQADGRVAFQETPCARSDKQAEVGAIQHAGAPAAAPAKSVADKPKAAPAVQNVCTQAGKTVFARFGRTQPHAAWLACQRELKDSQASEPPGSQCQEQCVDSWVEQYKSSLSHGNTLPSSR